MDRGLIGVALNPVRLCRPSPARAADKVAPARCIAASLDPSLSDLPPLSCPALPCSALPYPVFLHVGHSKAHRLFGMHEITRRV